MVDVVEEITGGRKVRKEYEDGELVRVTVEPLSEPGPSTDAPEASRPERRAPGERSKPGTSFFGRFSKRSRDATDVEKDKTVQAPPAEVAEIDETGPVESEAPTEPRPSFFSRFSRKPQEASEAEDALAVEDAPEPVDEAASGPDLGPAEVDGVEDPPVEPASAWEVEPETDDVESADQPEPEPEEPRPAGGLLARLRRRREALEADDDSDSPVVDDGPASMLVDEPEPEPEVAEPMAELADEVAESLPEVEVAFADDDAATDESWADPVPEVEREAPDEVHELARDEEIEPVEVGAADDWEPDADPIVEVAAPEDAVADADEDLPTFIVDFDEPEPETERESVPEVRVAEAPEVNREIVRGFLKRGARRTRESVSRPVPDQPYGGLLPRVDEEATPVEAPLEIARDDSVVAEELVTPVPVKELSEAVEEPVEAEPVEIVVDESPATADDVFVEGPMQDGENYAWSASDVEESPVAAWSEPEEPVAAWSEPEEPVAEVIANARYVEVPHDLERRVDHVLATYASRTASGMSAGYEELAIRVDSLTHRHGRSELAERVDALIAEREGARGGPVVVTTNEEADAVEVPVQVQASEPLPPVTAPTGDADAFAAVNGLPADVAALMHEAGFENAASLGAADAAVLTAALKRVAEARGVAGDVKLSEARAWGWIRAAQKVASRE